MNGPLIVFAAAFLVLLPRFNAAEAAGPYDGEWAGTATSTGERCKQAEAAAAKQAAADAELRDKLIAATGGNVIRGPGIDDVSPIRAAMEIIPAERILSAIRCKTDRRLYPKNEPATSWREPRLLREIAESYCRTMIVPNLVAAWTAAGRTPAAKATAHRDESSPVGVPPVSDMAMQAPDNLADAPEAPAGVEASPEPQTAPAAPPAQPVADPDDGPAIAAATEVPAEQARSNPDMSGSPAAVDHRSPVAAGRDQVLRAFARDRTPPQTAAPPQPAPQPPPPQAPNALVRRQVEQPPERQAEPISREGWEELVSGYVAGNVNWNPRRLGAPPGSPDCRAPRDVLRSFGL